MATVAPITRSRIERFDQTAATLSQLAGQLRTATTQWQNAADTYVEQIDTPNGTEWTGQMATRYFDGARTDQSVVNRAVDQARSIADDAERGADSLRGARESALEAISQAEEDNFNVGEDLSVSDRTSPTSSAARAARQQAAVGHRNYIAHCAGRLESENERIAAQLHTGAGEMTSMAPSQWNKQQGAQALDDKFKQDGPKPETSPRPGDMSSGDINAIERANLQLLDEMEQEYSQLPPGQVRTDRLADIAGIREALKTPDSHLIYLAKPDDPSQMIPAATAIGDPFKADHVSVTVPGVGSTTRQSLAGMTREAYGLRQEAQDIGRRVGDNSSVSTIAWMGYQPPLTMTSPETFTDGLAKANAPKLESFLGNLNAASINPTHTTALFGHSYGSLLSGIALKDGASANVSNVVLYGSPGFEATSPAQLGLSDNHFFVMSTPDDPIRPIGELAPLHGWGADPNAVIYGDPDRYRFTHLQTQAGTVDIGGQELNKIGASGHSEYGRDPLQRMTGYNLATILLNHPELSVKETLPPQ
jgi:hypothetical protein